MLRLFYFLIGTFFLFIILPKWLLSDSNTKEQDELLKNIALAANKTEQFTGFEYSQKGYVKVYGARQLLSDDFIQEKISEMPFSRQAFSYSWVWDGVKNATTSALSVDRRHYFVNSYLVNYEPFKTSQPWVPYLTLVHRKKYQYDHVTYPGMQDVWQNSQQSFMNTRGDCEDHAIALADWLIAMGIDARVVLGEYKNGGHAWVVANHDGTNYLLEATDKRMKSLWRAFPLARYETDYHPKVMFNRDYLWVNESVLPTTSYSGEHWVLKSRFYKLSQKK
ncbi:MAG: transglutaminase domain-containing protein [Gammaproteobacteria bacterium]|nr:transglutaminase domain-containing protein [Gammaproteobacteria bacterium]